MMVIMARISTLQMEAGESALLAAPVVSKSLRQHIKCLKSSKYSLFLCCCNVSSVHVYHPSAAI